MPETITQLEQRLGRKLTQFEYLKYLQQWPNVSLGNLFLTNATDAFSLSIENNIQSDVIDRARENFLVPLFSKPIEAIRPLVPEEESYVDRVQPLLFPSYLDIGRSGAPTATNLITSVSDKVPKNLSDNFKSFSFTDQIKPVEPPTIKLPSKLDDPSKFTKLGGNLSEGLSTALKVGELAGSAIGGKAGEIVSGAANSTSTIISAAKNLLGLGSLSEGTEGLGTAKAGNIGAIVGAASDFLGGFMPLKQEYGGEKGSITLGLDAAYDAASDIAMSLGPIGCVCAGSRVINNEGKFLNIEDLTKEEGILGWGNRKVNKENIFALKNPDYKECLRIELQSGTYLECSTDHPILYAPKGRADRITIDGKRVRVKKWEFKAAEELKIGDNVGIANEVPIWGNIEMWNPYLIGMLIGDGTYGKDHGVRLYSADPDTWNYIEDNDLGVRINFNDSEYNKEFRAYRIFDGPLHLKNLGIYEQTKNNKRLPINIHLYTKESICLLIAGLIDTDGCVLYCDSTKECKVIFYQKNKILIDLIRELLLKLGIHNSVQKTKLKRSSIRGREVNTQESYKIVIKDKLSLVNFYNNIKLNLTYKLDALNSIYEYCIKGSVKDNRLLSGAKADKVVNIIPIGLKLVYNLQADDDHTYIANGIITHNTMIGGAMKGGALLGKGLNAIGGGTDGMTTADAILGSSFLNLTPFGLINGFGGKKADTITKDMETWTNAGSSYDGSLGLVDFSLTRSGKKYGAFSSGARLKANRMIAEARRQQEIVGDITEEAQDLRDIQAGTSVINANRRKLQMQGGYLQANIRAAKQGGTLEPTFDEVVIEDISEEIVEFKQGGTIVETIDFLPITCEEVIIEEFQQGGTLEPTFDEELVMRDFFSDKAPFILRILDPNRTTIPDWENPEEKVASHRLSWDEFGTDEGVKIGIYPKVQLIDGELHDFTDPKYKHDELDASKSAWNNHNIYWVDSKDIANFITKNYKSYIPSFQKYAKGGAINVIPEGALHARKHHLDIDGITKKGIPVVSESKDGKILQQAEIECAEIILRLEVTQKLEEWLKEYNDDDLTQKEKDEVAIKAGKLLTKELIYNTQDNFGLT